MAEIVGEQFLFDNASLYWLTATAGAAAYVGYAQDAGWGRFRRTPVFLPR